MTFGDEEGEGGMEMTFGDEEEEEGGMSMTFGDEEFGEFGEESGSEEEEEGGMSATFGGEDFGDLGDSEEEESEEEEIIEKKSKGKKSVKFDDSIPELPLPIESTSADATTSTRYVPPHLRPKAIPTPSVFAPEPSTSTLAPAEIKQDPRLRRQIMGHLNKLSSSNISSILKIITALYVTNPRATISAILTSLLLEIVSGRDNLGEAFVINYAALVAALGKEIGIEFTAGVVAKAVMVFDKAYNEPSKEVPGEGFEGRPGSKVCENIVTFLAELYNFGVVACLLIYDLVRLCIEQGLGELEVELLVKIVKSEFSFSEFDSILTEIE